MRAILLAKATVATCGRLRDVRLTSHVLKPEDCLVFCSSTVCAPCTKSLRRYLFPRLLVPVSFCLPPVECSPGTTPSQAENPRPFLNAAPLPMAATVAVAVIGPIPGIATRRVHCSSSPQMRAISLLVSSICHADIASPTAVGSEVRAMHRTVCCPRLPGCRGETPQYSGVLCEW